MDEIGDVPRLAFVTKLTPNALMKRPTRKMRYRFVLSIRLTLLVVIYWQDVNVYDYNNVVS